MKLAALAPVLLFAVSLAASAAGQGAFGRVPPPNATLPPPPPALGFPHAILTGNGNGCAREPGPNEVIIFRDESFRGPCAALQPGFYPHGANLVIGERAIRSMKIGSHVRARSYDQPSYGGAFGIGSPGAYATLGSMNDRISSMRVDPPNRNPNCADLVEGEVGLYEGYAGTGDCVVLPGDGSFPNADTMGLANDSITSIRNNSNRTLWGYWNDSFGVFAISMPPHTSLVTLEPRSGGPNPNNNLSSIKML